MVYNLKTIVKKHIDCFFIPATVVPPFGLYSWSSANKVRGKRQLKKVEINKSVEHFDLFILTYTVLLISDTCII